MCLFVGVFVYVCVLLLYLLEWEEGGGGGGVLVLGLIWFEFFYLIGRILFE